MFQLKNQSNLKGNTLHTPAFTYTRLPPREFSHERIQFLTKINKGFKEHGHYYKYPFVSQFSLDIEEYCGAGCLIILPSVMGKSKGKNNSKKPASNQNGPAESSRNEIAKEDDTLSSELKKTVDLKVEDDKSAGALSSDGLECPICKKTALSRCGGCNRVGYCSREHQRQDWKVHKANCSLWKVAQSPELGRYLIATREIKAGSIILQEKPLLLVPPRITAPVCLGCYNELISPEDVQEGMQLTIFS